MKSLLKSACVITLGLLAVEAVCRFTIGLGDPPLSTSDPEMEYLWKPSQVCHPFHHLVKINSYSMRSDDFPPTKTNNHELRVLVLGDSVVYDGAQIDQQDICTEVLKRTLQRDLLQPVTVGNIGAKSWGPPNELAYIKRFGVFDADWLILVLNSGDYADVPTFRPVVDVDPDYPAHKPLFALKDALMRYLPRYLPKSLRPYKNPDENPNPTQRDIDWSLSSERQIIELARSVHTKVIVAQMLETSELNGREKVGHGLMLNAARSENAQILQIGELFAKAVTEGENPYLDNIHPNVLGCKIMGESMAKAIEASSMLPSRELSPRTTAHH